MNKSFVAFWCIAACPNKKNKKNKHCVKPVGLSGYSCCRTSLLSWALCSAAGVAYWCSQVGHLWWWHTSGLIFFPYLSISQTASSLQLHMTVDATVKPSADSDTWFVSRSTSPHRGNCRPIRFEPPMLDFHEQWVVCIAFTFCWPKLKHNGYIHPQHRHLSSTDVTNLTHINTKVKSPRVANGMHLYIYIIYFYTAAGVHIDPCFMTWHSLYRNSSGAGL